MDLSAVPPVNAFPPLPRPEAVPAERVSPGTSVGVGVEIARRDHGVDVVRFVDRSSGLVIYQNPPEQVLNMVTQVIESIRQWEGSDG